MGTKSRETIFSSSIRARHRKLVGLRAAANKKREPDKPAPLAL
jgi:hypothetical protein